MSNPLRAPKEPTLCQLELSAAPDAFLPDEGERPYLPLGEFPFDGQLVDDSGHRLPISGRREARMSALNNLDYQKLFLRDLDVEPAHAVLIPKEFSCNPAVLQRAGTSMALAKKGKMSLRIRSAYAKRLINKAYALLPSDIPEDMPMVDKANVEAVMRSKVSADGGVENTLGRLYKYYPRRGASVAALRPVTREEAACALMSCGLKLSSAPSGYPARYPLVAQRGELSVTVNRKADNGFPVEGKWDDPGAAEKCHGLAIDLRHHLEGRRDNVVGAVRDLERRAPWLMALKGKAKGDYYSIEKVMRFQLRFYNCLPRQVIMVMQQATQPFEAQARHMLSGYSPYHEWEHGAHTGIGVVLQRGGAQRVVDALQRQLDGTNEAYVHVGDDSWLIVRRGEEIMMAQLDCSSFDLTQHNSVTQEIHQSVFEELKLIDPISAGLWYAYMRERLVVGPTTLAARWKHGGPSGMPLQSKVNDMLMDVAIKRVLMRLRAEADVRMETVSSVIAAVGAELGLSVRLDQYSRACAYSIENALFYNAFVFIGYIWWSGRNGPVNVMADVARQFSQVPYPGLKWTGAKEEHDVMEAMRLGAIALSWGIPHPRLGPAFRAFRLGAIELLDAVLGQHGDRTDERLVWAAGQSPFLEELAPSLLGLRTVLGQFERLWGPAAAPLTRALTPVPESWADEVDAELQPYEPAAPPIELPGRRPYPLTLTEPPTHPWTMANWGRLPPTAVWGPDKPPRAADEAGPSSSARRRQRRKGRKMGLVPSSDDFSLLDEASSELSEFLWEPRERVFDEED